MWTELLVLLLLLTEPLVAEPPVVLPETLALPELALCELLLLTRTLLSLLTRTVLFSLKRIWLFESGPVLLMLPEFEPLPFAPLSADALELELLTETLELAELLLLALPLLAPPALVLCVAEALPESAFWSLLLLTPAELEFLTVVDVVPLWVIWLLESGPVVPILPEAADAKPALRTTPDTANPNVLSNFFMSYSFLII